ncbi:hypothetical protein [Clostridium lundense]|uniref:hypothetical protein n=1 Tax=Clostridium lundense TaxID=319475 RepID=UPI000A85FF84|nr:hypothetical protein [Clostridium lundense]
MKNKILALIVGVGIVGASSFAVFASSGTDANNAANNKVKSCCTQNAQCCIEKSACCK